MKNNRSRPDCVHILLTPCRCISTTVSLSSKNPNWLKDKRNTECECDRHMSVICLSTCKDGRNEYFVITLFDIKTRSNVSKTHLDCQGVMTPSSGPPTSTSLLSLKKFFFHSAGWKRHVAFFLCVCLQKPCYRQRILCCRFWLLWLMGTGSMCVTWSKSLAGNLISTYRTSGWIQGRGICWPVEFGLGLSLLSRAR